MYLKYWLEFLTSFTEKEIKARYKYAVLGFLWVLLNPLLQMLIIGLVFQFFIPVKVNNYFLFLLTGLLPWNFLSMGLSKTTPMFVYERNLIQKAKFPRESIVLSVILSNLFHLVISLLLLIIAVIFLGKFNFLSLLLLPIALIWLTLLTIGISLITSSLNVRFRDINFFVQAVLPLWFYASPVVYSLNLIPQSLHRIFYLNPMTAILELFRFSLMSIPIQRVDLLIISLIISLFSILFGVIVFKKESIFFDDWL